MLLFAGKRLASLVLTMFVSSIVIFGSLYLVPGDPAVYLAGSDKVTPEQLDALRAEYNLDDPFLTRYVDWLGGVLHGNFGQSLQYKESVGHLLAGRIPTSGLLVAYAGVLILVVGLTMGLIGALNRGAIDRAVLVIISATIAMPVFVSAVLLLTVFSVELGWFPATGGGAGLLDRLWHLTLPAIALALSLSGAVARVARASFVDSVDRDHVAVARSRGIPERHVVRRHVVRNALGPVATMAGLVIAGLIVTTTIVETAFGLNGIGSLLQRSVAQQDFPVVQAISLVVVAAFLVCNTIVDLLYPIIDPRVASWRRPA
ncbi:ABC transporter permease [Sphaerisporangium sp. NPDC051017]|uniref:ABC transporter permease n=1 Tax=Sphaerisporangium sp. NPDC051017 TaxID=3154636 RepID=UPI003424F40D